VHSLRHCSSVTQTPPDSFWVYSHLCLAATGPAQITKRVAWATRGCSEPGPQVKRLFTWKWLLASTRAKFPVFCLQCLLLLLSTQLLALLQKPAADKKAWPSQDSKRETVQAHTQSSRWVNKCILTSRESTCSCPQFHTSSLSLTLLHLTASYLQRKQHPGLSLEPLGSTSGREPLPGAHQEELPHQK